MSDTIGHRASTLWGFPILCYRLASLHSPSSLLPVPFPRTRKRFGSGSPQLTMWSIPSLTRSTPSLAPNASRGYHPLVSASTVQPSKRFSGTCKYGTLSVLTSSSRSGARCIRRRGTYFTFVYAASRLISRLALVQRLIP